MADKEESPEVDQETLMQLLKEKAKELKQTQKKLKKVEDKFVEIHKAQKNLIDDREVLLQFLQLVFPQKILDWGRLEEEIMIMPEGQDFGQEGYGSLDYNHLRQFWTLESPLEQQKRDNENMSVIMGLQDPSPTQEQEEQLKQKLTEAQNNQSQGEQTTSDIQQKMNSLLEENDRLKEKIQDLSNDDKMKTMRVEIEQQYIKQISDMEKSVREVKAENSEFKAQQLMNVFQGQGGGELPSFQPQ